MSHKCIFIHAADSPRIIADPQGLKDAIPGICITLIVQATGTEPLRYQWKLQQCATLCDVESFPGANSSTLTIASVQKSNEGSYHCTVSNCADSVTSECATLSVGKNHFEKAVQYICTLAVLTVQHTGRSFSFSVVPGHNSSEHISIFIVCKQSQQHAVLVPLQLTLPELPLTHVR